MRKQTLPSDCKRKLIRSTGELAALIFAHLDASEPQIPVEPVIAAAKRALRRELKWAKLISSPPAYFGEILSAIYWTDPPPEAERCGLQLLLFMGELSHAMYKYELYKIPALRATQIIFDCYAGDDLRFVRINKKWYVKSTAAFAEKFGVAVRVKLPQQAGWDTLDLSDLLDE
jgi:hypothetical protein